MEEFFQNYQYTFSALGAIGTLLAVITSLYFGYRSIKESDTKIKAYLCASCIFEEGEKKESYITVYITNIGLYPVSIPWAFFSVKPFFVKNYNNNIATIGPLDSYNTEPLITYKKYPFKIEPKHNEIFIVFKKKTFIEEFIPAVLKNNKSNTKFNIMTRLPLSFFYHFIKIEVLTGDGKFFKVKIDKKLSKELKEYLAQNN